MHLDLPVYPKYDVYVSDWYRKTADGLRPYIGRRKYLARNVSFAEARKSAAEYNATHEPGELQRKAQFVKL